MLSSSLGHRKHSGREAVPACCVGIGFVSSKQLAELGAQRRREWCLSRCHGVSGAQTLPGMRPALGRVLRVELKPCWSSLLRDTWHFGKSSERCIALEPDTCLWGQQGKCHPCHFIAERNRGSWTETLPAQAKTARFWVTWLPRENHPQKADPQREKPLQKLPGFLARRFRRLPRMTEIRSLAMTFSLVLLSVQSRQLLAYQKGSWEPCRL